MTNSKAFWFVAGAASYWGVTKFMASKGKKKA